MLDALGDPTRRVILETLRRGGPCSVSTLAGQVPVSRPAISQHLKVLGAVGLVRHESRGTRNIYRVHRAGLDELRDWLDQFWGDALEAYAGHIRRTEERTEERTGDRNARRTEDRAEERTPERATEGPRRSGDER